LLILFVDCWLNPCGNIQTERKWFQISALLEPPAAGWVAQSSR